MTTHDFTIQVFQSKRHLKARLSQSHFDPSTLQKLVIIATGLHSHMDKESQIKTSNTYQNAGFDTLQFNFTGHGQGQNKSDGTLNDITLSSSIQDLKTIWDYAQTKLPVSPNQISIHANSYGALISLLALEKNLISPESMVLIAPFSMDKFKQLRIPLSILTKFMPEKITKILKLPISSEMLIDFLKKHTRGMEKKDLLSNTAIHFFVGSQDKVSSPKTIQKWCQQFNTHQPKNVPFVDSIQAHYKEYPDVKHFNIPDEIHQDIMMRSIDFINLTRRLRSR